jgi:beta-glucosidase
VHEFKLKPGFKIGTATAATQTEGGDLGHSWNEWYKKGHIKDGADPARADKHYDLWKEDTELMKSLGFPVYRMGVEWARIEPQKGIFNEDAIKHYTDEIKLLNSFGIKPLVTLHHFSNPGWFDAMGAFAKTENIDYFLEFAKKIVSAFGKDADEYCTINEPNVYASHGYFFGVWPPGEKSFSLFADVLSNLALAHILTCEKIHELFPEAKVGFAHHSRPYVPKNPLNPLHRFYAWLGRKTQLESLEKAFYFGRFEWPLTNFLKLKPGQYSDFIGLNYYSRSVITGPRDGVKENVPVNDLGWEIYPQGLVECAEKLHKLLPLPIYVTENGTCDNSDAFRSLYLYEHLKAISESELPFERYYHWSFTDNWEWLEGESARFGIVHVDYESQKRTVKNSGKFLSAVSASGGVTDEIYNWYVKGQKYRTNREPEQEST